ncbi:MAG TPA: Na(+)/H(+) antiporter subunit C [Nocardioidaceae bacterium]
MTANLTLILVASTTVGAGVYLVLERSLSRVLIGLVMISNGVNLLLLTASGPAGKAPLTNLFEASGMADPLPQALVLTAIVITLGTTAFMLAMAHRAWQVNGSDDVQDDVEDRIVRRRAEEDVPSDTYGLTQRGEYLAGDEQTVSVPAEAPVATETSRVDDTEEEQ